MSVISESAEQMIIVVISQFVACQYGTSFTWEDSREFNIGDKVKFLDAFEDTNVRQEHLKWKVKFLCEDGNVYAASQLYFVTIEAWEEIVKHFKISESNQGDGSSGW